jgi:hypothetical protein
MKYEYRETYSVLWKNDVSNRTDIALPELNQGILSYWVSVNNGEDIIGIKSAYIVMEMYEDFLEPLKEGTYFMEKEVYDYSQCVVGDAWLKYATQEGDTTLINVSGYPCEVMGILKSNTLAGSDERIFLYGPSMPSDFLDDAMGIEESMSVDYRISEKADTDQIEKYKTWLNSGIFESIEDNDLSFIDGDVNIEFASIMPIYNKLFVAIMIFCFVNCAFLTYVWCVKKVQENMTKRVFGFSVMRIWWDGLKELALYEGISIITSSVICLVIELFRGDAGNFFVTWKDGVGIMAEVLLLYTLLLSMINVFYIRKIKPADTMKAAE